jgi:hypothetical protein
MSEGYWLSALARKPASGPGDARPLRPELLPITGSVSDSRARTIDPRDYERRLPKRLTPLLALVVVLLISLILWWALWTLVLALWRWAEPAATVLAGLLGGAVLGMFLIGLGLLG